MKCPLFYDLPDTDDNLPGDGQIQLLLQSLGRLSMVTYPPLVDNAENPANEAWRNTIFAKGKSAAQPNNNQKGLLLTFGFARLAMFLHYAREADRNDDLLVPEPAGTHSQRRLRWIHETAKKATWPDSLQTSAPNQLGVVPGD